MFSYSSLTFFSAVSQLIIYIFSGSESQVWWNPIKVASLCSKAPSQSGTPAARLETNMGQKHQPFSHWDQRFQQTPVKQESKPISQRPSWTTASWTTASWTMASPQYRSDTDTGRFWTTQWSPRGPSCWGQRGLASPEVQASWEQRWCWQRPCLHPQTLSLRAWTQGTEPGLITGSINATTHSKGTNQVHGLQSGAAGEGSRDRAGDKVAAWVQGVHQGDGARSRTGQRHNFGMAQAALVAVAWGEMGRACGWAPRGGCAGPLGLLMPSGPWHTLVPKTGPGPYRNWLQL